MDELQRKISRIFSPRLLRQVKELICSGLKDDIDMVRGVPILKSDKLRCILDENVMDNNLEQLVNDLFLLIFKELLKSINIEYQNIYVKNEVTGISHLIPLQKILLNITEGEINLQNQELGINLSDAKIQEISRGLQDIRTKQNELHLEFLNLLDITNKGIGGK